MKKILYVIFAYIIITALMITEASAKPDVKTKFYNFDDLLINGEYKKPQLLYIDTKQKIKFEKLLRLKKDLLPRLKDTQRDPSLR